jgi:hypothetical protein
VARQVHHALDGLFLRLRGRGSVLSQRHRADRRTQTGDNNQRKRERTTTTSGSDLQAMSFREP